MPKYRTEIEHPYPTQNAVDRLQAYFEKVGPLCDLSGSWQESTYAFTASAQGMKIRGEAKVEDRRILFAAEVPLFALPFTGWVPSMVIRALNEGGDLLQRSSTEPQTMQGPQPPAADVGPVVLFLHIPKAGGSTLGEYIYNQCRTDGVPGQGLLDCGIYFCPFGFFKEPGLVTPPYAREVLARPDLVAAVGHFWYGIHEALPRKASYITLLREPVDRVISLYYYLDSAGQIGLKEFAENPPYKEVDNDQTRRIAGVDPEIGRITEAHYKLAVANLESHFAVAGTIERLEDTLKLLRSAFGWQREVACCTRNVNASRPRTEAVENAALEAIRDRNRYDLRLYDYVNRRIDRDLAAMR